LLYLIHNKESREKSNPSKEPRKKDRTYSGSSREPLRKAGKQEKTIGYR
jgi:hypothetical protein